MADRIRLVNLQWPKPPAVLVDFAPPVIGPVRDSFAITFQDATASLAAATTRWGGERTVTERRQNATLAFTILALGQSTNGALSLVQNVLENALAANTPELAIEWRPDGATTSEYWRLRGPAKFGLSYSWSKMASANYLPVDISFPVAPTAEPAPYDIFDDFSVDTLALGDWVQDAGANSLTVSGGTLIPPTTGAAVPAMRYRHQRGYPYGDIEVSMKVKVSASGVANGNWRICLCMDPTGAANYLALELTSTGSQLIKVVGGTRTVLSTAGSFSAGSSTTNYMLLRKAGNVLYWRIATSKNWTEWTVEPNTYQLTQNDLQFAGYGHVGFEMAAGLNDETYDDFSARAFVYRGVNTPEQIQLIGPIVGEAPAMADIEVTPVVGASTSPAIFGLVAFGERPQVHNLCTGGSLQTVKYQSGATYGWTVAAITGVQGAATSYIRGLGGGLATKYSIANLQIAMPATAGTGAAFLATRRFKRGNVYAAWAWYLNDTTGGNRSVQLKLGVNGDIASGTTVSMSGGSGIVGSVVWQPTADYDAAYLSIQQSTALSGTTEADGINIVESPAITLSASMTSSQTTMSPFYTPTTIPGLNPDGSLRTPFLVLVDREFMMVTAIAGTVWTVSRSQENSNAATHAANSYVIVCPPARPQFEGRGALPAFAVIDAEFGASDRQAPTLGASTDYRSGGYAAYAGNGNFEWYVDPSTILPDDFTQGDVLVEVWGRFAFDPAMVGGTLVTSCSPSEQYDPTTAVSSLAGQRRYTFEYGTAGMAIVPPAGSSGTLVPQYLKLGVLPMVADRSRPQRWRVSVAYAQTSGAGIRGDYIQTFPVRSRLATATGKSSTDPTYSSFVPNVVAANAITKILRSDGSALVRVPRLSTVRAPDAFPDAGIGGGIDLPNTDCDLQVKLSQLVPNDPGAQAMEMFTAQPSWQAMVHVAVTPRFVSVRGA